MDNKFMDVKKCARCWKDHDNLEFKAFSYPPKKYSFFAICPTNGEPILMFYEMVKE